MRWMMVSTITPPTNSESPHTAGGYTFHLMILTFNQIANQPKRMNNSSRAKVFTTTAAATNMNFPPVYIKENLETNKHTQRPNHSAFTALMLMDAHTTLTKKNKIKQGSDEHEVSQAHIHERARRGQVCSLLCCSIKRNIKWVLSEFYRLKTIRVIYFQVLDGAEVWHFPLHVLPARGSDNIVQLIWINLNFQCMQHFETLLVKCGRAIRD